MPKTLIEQLSGIDLPEINMPVGLQVLTPLQQDKDYTPHFSRSTYYRTDQFVCEHFYKPISKI